MVLPLPPPLVAPPARALRLGPVDPVVGEGENGELQQADQSANKHSQSGGAFHAHTQIHTCLWGGQALF